MPFGRRPGFGLIPDATTRSTPLLTTHEPAARASATTPTKSFTNKQSHSQKYQNNPNQPAEKPIKAHETPAMSRGNESSMPGMIPGLGANFATAPTSSRERIRQQRNAFPGFMNTTTGNPDGNNKAYRHPNAASRAPDTADKNPVPQDSHGRPAFQSHRRRQSVRLTSLPPIPPHLGPIPFQSGQFSLGRAPSNVSGNNNGLSGNRNSLSSRSSGIASGPNPNSNKKDKVPILFGLYQTVPNANNGPVAQPIPFVHSRSISDPFIDATAITSVPAGALQSPQTYKFPDLSPEARMPNSMLSDMRNDGPSYPMPSNPYPARGELPIPPPPLPAITPYLHHNPAQRAVLDAHVIVREDWIRDSAAEIVHLARAAGMARDRWLLTRLPADHRAYQVALVAYEAATDFDIKQEERRNIFMPQGMQAMKTEGGDAEPTLLPYPEAYVERVCAEMKRAEDLKKEDDNGKITAEMIATMSLEEKKALRDHLVKRVRMNTARRSE